MALIPSVKIKAFMVFLWMLITLTSTAQSAEQIVNNYLKAIGGVEKWNSIETSITECLFIKTAPIAIRTLNRKDTLTAITKYKRPNKVFYRSFEKEGSPSSIMCYNSDFFWTQSNSGQLSIQSKEDGDYFLKVNMIGLADVLLEENAEIEYLGIEKLQETEFYTLRVKREGWTLSYKYFFDLNTGLPFCSMAIGSMIKRYAVFKDYRRNEGVMFHHLEETYDDQWNLESKAIFINRMINVPIADSEFNAPQSK